MLLPLDETRRCDCELSHMNYYNDVPGSARQLLLTRSGIEGLVHDTQIR